MSDKLLQPIRMVCSQCGSDLVLGDSSLRCSSCDRKWEIVDGIPRFFPQACYWGEIPEGLLQEVNRRCCQTNWRSAVEGLVRPGYPDICEYIVDPARSDFRWLLPLGPECDILDVGAGWGTLTHGLAPFCKTVVALESVDARLDFIAHRATQARLDNVYLVQGNFLDIPYPPKSFDVVLLNGVLEWTGAADTSVSPDQAQRRLLVKVRELLRPGGCLYVGIENRFGYNLILGAPDHSGLPYTSLLPRWLADIFMRGRKIAPNRTGLCGDGYRTYTYSYWGYQALLRQTGFGQAHIYAAFPSYNWPDYLVPLESPGPSAYLLKRIYLARTSRRRAVLALIRRMSSLTSFFFKMFSPSFIIIVPVT